MLRKLTQDDRAILAAWITDDPFSDGRKYVDFWYDPKQFAVCAADEKGPVIYLRFEAQPPEMRIHMQFCVETRRIVRIMLMDWDEVRELVVSTGATGIVFESQSPKLVAFCEKAYGFKRVGESNDYWLDLQRVSHEQA
jgi:hypothetical protein